MAARRRVDGLGKGPEGRIRLKFAAVYDARPARPRAAHVLVVGL